MKLLNKVLVVTILPSKTVLKKWAIIQKRIRKLICQNYKDSLNLSLSAKIAISL